jgi:glycosidase
MVHFRFAPPADAAKVYVAGTFNDWNSGEYPLHKVANSAYWSTNVRVPVGVYVYRFVVNGHTWLSDPNAPGVDDGNNNINSRLVVAPEYFAGKPGKVGDGIITTGAIEHVQDRRFLWRYDSVKMVIGLKTRANDVQRCVVITPEGVSYFLHKYDSDALFDRWRARIPGSGTPRDYAFLVEDGTATVLYDRTGAHAYHNGQPVRWFTVDPNSFPLPSPPAWTSEAVFYQIFPDRFWNGDPTNDGPGVKPWGTTPSHTNRMGGDLAGVDEKLTYLKSLGVNAIYFNPIFTADSNHGYDTRDYLHVDPRFGTNQQLANVVSKVHKFGWHVILDGVFNHTGVNTRWFKSIEKLGAKSPYVHYYYIKHFPVRVHADEKSYVSWFGVPTLPKLDLDNPATRKYMLNVGTYWIEHAHIDGWRLDASDQVDPRYWVAFRKHVRAQDPGAYIMGENWGDSHAWLQGDMFDAVMNYPWRQLVLNFFAYHSILPTQFRNSLRTVRNNAPAACTNVMFNLLGSHDTVRVATIFDGKLASQMQAIVFQFTYPGIPTIYYGDEIGLKGGPDPDDRRCMIWDKSKWNMPLLNLTKQLISLRKKYPVFDHGNYTTVRTNDRSGVFAFKRVFKTKTSIVAFNNSDKATDVNISVKYNRRTAWQTILGHCDSLQQEPGQLVFVLKPHGYVVLFRG